MIREYYKVLGIKENATKDEIRKAYLKKAKRFHPDSGGDNLKNKTAFSKINEAYKTLHDDEARKTYDKTGIGKEIDSRREIARQLIFELLTNIIEDLNITISMDITSIMKKSVTANITDAEKALAVIKLKIEKAKKTKERLIYKGEDNLLPIFIDNLIEKLEIEEKKKAERLSVLGVMYELIKDYTFKPEGTDWVTSRLSSFSIRPPFTTTTSTF